MSPPLSISDNLTTARDSKLQGKHQKTSVPYSHNLLERIEPKNDDQQVRSCCSILNHDMNHALPLATLKRCEWRSSKLSCVTSPITSSSKQNKCALLCQIWQKVKVSWQLPQHLVKLVTSRTALRRKNILTITLFTSSIMVHWILSVRHYLFINFPSSIVPKATLWVIRELGKRGSLGNWYFKWETSLQFRYCSKWTVNANQLM